MVRKVIAGAAVCTAAVMGAAALLTAGNVHGSANELPMASEAVSVSVTAREPAGESFVLRLNGGYIDVYLADRQEEPVARVEIDESALRAADRQLLRHGIDAGSYEEALSLLEDFNS